MSKGRILVAEDDAVLRSLYIRKLSAEGFDVETAEDGQKTIDAIRQRTPDLVLCDIHMPVKDGFQVLKEFPKESRTFSIIMLTNLEGDFQERSNELGADGYFIKKDMTIKKLVEMVGKMVKRG